jgi:uncharacterized FlgJ-related protein
MQPQKKLNFSRKFNLRSKKIIIIIKKYFINFLHLIDIFYKFNTFIIGKSKIALSGPLKKHYTKGYARGSVIACLIFAMLFRPDFNNSANMESSVEKKISENKSFEENTLIIDQNLYDNLALSQLKNSKKENNNFQYTDKQILGFGNNIDARTIISLFEEENYNLQDIRNGKAVEPIFLSKLPTGIKNINNIRERKKLFIKVILPLIIFENNKILEDRDNLSQIYREKTLNANELSWLKSKFKEYRIKDKNMEELKVRMDIIPPSLAIAQAAYETGWGTSRFAMEGNSLYGVRTWKKGRGIIPNERTEEQKFEVLSYKIIRASISSYKKNLNTHQSYKEFRSMRSQQRKKLRTISGLELSKYLNKYSEIGNQYVERLKKIIEQNSLMDFDDAILSRKKKPSIV